MRTSGKEKAAAKKGPAKKKAPTKRKVLSEKEKPRKRTTKKASAKKKMPKPSSAARKKKSGEKGCRAINRVDDFVRQYLVDLNGRKAAIRAGYSPASARQTASELLATPEVREAVTKAMIARAKRTEITQDMVLKRFWAIATSDPREMMELYRSCCRYCWGDGHRYQRTPSEREAEYREWYQTTDRGPDDEPVFAFDEAGGIGYNPRRDPNPECPECFGEGVERVFAKDTRDLSPAAQMLFAGVKTTQNGLEVKTHDQQKALVSVAKHLGMFKDRVELTGADGKELQPGVVVIPAKADSSKKADVECEKPVAKKARSKAAAKGGADKPFRVTKPA